MLRQARRYAALNYFSLSEVALRLCGRRPPYGILRIDLAGELSEETPSYRLLGLPQRRRSDYFSVIALLRWAREDPQVRAVLIRCGDLHIGWAKIQELHRSIGLLRAAGKIVWIYLTHAGMPEYVLASAAQQIILTPAGTLDITGLSTEVTFVAGALQKLGIEAELVQMGRYKAAGETFTRTEMSAAHREMADALIHDLYEQITDAIASGREMDHVQVKALLDRGPFVAREAQQQRLVDALLYEDEAEERLRRLCEDAAIIEMHDYLRRRGRWLRRELLRHRGLSIGVLHLTGTLKTGESIPGSESASACGSASVMRDLQELRERRDIRAVVIRVSSPGGSGLASDLMWHEVVRTRKRKPVVVSFGDVAASGGYYVGVAGRPIVAEAGTITGSIGVLAGKVLLRGLYDHLGVTKEIVTRGRHAAMHSDYLPLGDEERQRLRTEAEFFYADFVEKVANGREISHTAVAAAAEGRVWTGRQALALGLVDQLGGIECALDQAKTLAGFKAADMLAVERYPKPKRLWKISLNTSPVQNRTTMAFPWLKFARGERVWAVLPFHFRFF